MIKMVRLNYTALANLLREQQKMFEKGILSEKYGATPDIEIEEVE